MSQATSPSNDADVIVVGAGPGGSATAYHLARLGLDVLLLEKTHFPREKVCGDGLTPRAVKQLVDMGIDTSESAGWKQNKGLRIVGGGHTLEMAWPDLSAFPGHGLVRTRADFDEILARRAAAAGAKLIEGANVTGAVIDDRTGRIAGVTARLEGAGPDELTAFRAPLVVAADGNSARLALSLGMRKRDDRPMGVAVRTYFTSPRHDEDWLESWLELWDYDDAGNRTDLLPGYGWIFPMGDGTCNVGLGVLNTSAAFGKVDNRQLLRRWLDHTPAEWQFDTEHQIGPVRGAALPMGFNRKPHYTRGLLLVGDSGGMVNPFNGEGIAYAMESGALAAEVIAQAKVRRTSDEAERALQAYPKILADTYGGYYTLGRAFVKLIGNPTVMKVATKHGLSHRHLMQFTLKLLANLTEPKGGDAYDRVINGLTKIVPAA